MNLSFKTILKHLSLAGIVLIAFLLLAMLFTNWFTKHGESTKVPKIEGMPLENAYAVLEKEGLELEVIDSVYKEDMKPLAITEQDPPADMLVKPGRTIYVIVNTGKKPKVKMPSLVNNSSNLASVLLQNAGLKLGRVDSVLSTLGNGLVIRQKYKGKDIAPKTQLEKGSIIDITVSKLVSNKDSTSIKQMTNGVMDENKINESD